MIKNITLTSSMRSNLASLKNIATQMSKTQNILSTGKKINSAIDNASNYYQARALTNRAADLNNLLDNMGQGIQTIQVATQGLDSALNFVEQATAVANQAISMDKIEISYKQYLSEGYKEITSAMSHEEIQNLLIDGAKLIFKDDIVLTQGLEINNNVTILGNGKTLTVNANDTSAIIVKGKDIIADINGLTIIANGNNAIGIKAIESGTIKIDNINNISAKGTGATPYYFCNTELFNGKEYTLSIYEQLCESGNINNTAIEYAVNYKAANVADDHAIFGVNQWYLGSIGEWTDLYGYDYSETTDTENIVVKNERPIDKINETLLAIGGNTAIIRSDYYWTVSETSTTNCMIINIGNGKILGGNKSALYFVRCFKNIENCYNPSIQDGPKIGDIMYSDNTWGSKESHAKNEALGKIAVGVVIDSNIINGDVKIISLENAPIRLKLGGYNKNFEDVPNISTSTIISSLKNTGKITVTYEEALVSKEQTLSDQFCEILNEYNNLIYDASYQGVNLLNGGNLTVTLNETRNHKIDIAGVDAKYDALGIKTIRWKNLSDIKKSLNEVTEAVGKLREYSENFGNQYQIIQARQNFTDALSDVLEVGADKLVLADMNEASAEYLILQTRQQLAVNSLSLASQSAKSVLSLF